MYFSPYELDTMATFSPNSVSKDEPFPGTFPVSAILEVEVVDVIYCGVVVKTTYGGKTIYFAIELFPQNAKQGTKPVSHLDATEAWPDRSNVNMDEARAYWISSTEKNADGSRKGGAFAEANLSLKGIPIGAELNVEIIQNTDINTVVMVSNGDAKPFKAFACAKPSPQFAVDTYIMCRYQGELHIRVIKRQAAGPDYPGAWAIIGGFLNGGHTVTQGRAAELEEEGGIVIGDNRVIVIEMGERNTPGREPRYMPFSYENTDGELITFGCERGSTANAVVHLVIPKDPCQLPRLAKATDEAEVVKGEWMPLPDFLAISNDPASGDYVAWRDHQAGARDAADLLRQHNLV